MEVKLRALFLDLNVPAGFGALVILPANSIMARLL